MCDQVAAGVKTAVIPAAQQDAGWRQGHHEGARQSATEPIVRGTGDSRKTRCCAGWPPRANRIEEIARPARSRAVRRAESRRDASPKGSGRKHCRRAACAAASGPLLFVAGLVVLQNHHQRRSALLYPRKTACNGSRAASCAPHQAKEKAPLGSRLSRAVPFHQERPVDFKSVSLVSSTGTEAVGIGQSQRPPRPPHGDHAFHERPDTYRTDRRWYRQAIRR